MDWLKQARRKLESSRWALEGKFWENSAFDSQQAAEMAAKSLMMAKKMEYRGHMISKMMKKLDAPIEIVEMAQELDHHYTNARYPDAYDSGVPMEYYNEKIATKLIEYAECIIKFVEDEIRKL